MRSKASIRSSHVVKSRWKIAWCFLVSWGSFVPSFSFCLPEIVASRFYTLKFE